ncbi:MAG: short-chain dehydrogenase, partial [Thermoleophilia bacterium]|nr:short-chain dehydrogenase [Thermoleophilia bacterium]
MTPETMPGQEQERQPGTTSEMTPKPSVGAEWYRGSGKLEGRRALITGGDSGIGQAVAILFAREGADIGISYLDEHDDAERTRELVEAEGRTCTLLPGDIGDPEWSHELVRKFVEGAGGLDILVNNAAEQHVAEDLGDIDAEQLQRTFDTNIFAMFHVT